MTRTIAAREGAGVVQVEAEVLGNVAAGAYRHLTLVTPGLAELARPGQFVALSVGDGTSSMLLRRSFSIHRVSPAGTTSVSGSGGVGNARPSASPGTSTTTVSGSPAAATTSSAASPASSSGSATAS